MKRFAILALAAALAFTGCAAPAAQSTAAQPDSSPAVSSGVSAAASASLLDCTGSEDVTITRAGSYTLTGDLQGCVVVDAGKNDKVELILQDLTVTAADGPAIWVKKADSVTVTLPEGSSSSLTDGSVYTGQTDEEPNAALFCDADLTIAGSGALTVTGSFDHAIRCKDDLTVEGGVLTLSAPGKGLKGKGSITVTGGDITVTASEEGMEANAITLAGGTISVTASDDGINASSPDNWTGDAPSLTITGGTVLVDAGGDGLDSNGSLTMSGGVLLIAGPTSSGDGALDAESTPVITGGVVIAASARGMAAGFGGSSTQASWLASTGDQPGGTSLTLVDASGAVLAHWTPGKAYQCAVVSAPGMTVGGSYTLLTGAAVEATDANGFADSGTASGGETAAQTTLDSLSQSDTQGMGGKGGMRGGFGGTMPDGARPERSFEEDGGRMGMTPPDAGAGSTPDMKNEMREFGSIGENA